MGATAKESDTKPQTSDGSDSTQSSVCGIRTIIKSGSSEALTLTKEFATIGLGVGDSVAYRLSRPTDTFKNQCQVLDLSESGQYSIHNADWVVTRDSSDSVPDFDENHLRDLHDLHVLYSRLIESINTSTNQYSDSKFLRYDQNIGSFVYTKYDKINLNQIIDPSLKTIDDVRRCLINLHILSDIIRVMNRLESPLKLTSEIADMIDGAFVVCSDLLHSNNPFEGIQELNESWERRQQALLSVEGHYVCLFFVQSHHDYSEQLYYTHGFTVVKRSSAEAAENDAETFVRSSWENRDDLLDHVRAQAFGPFTEADAKRFREYLEIGIDLNYSSSDEDSIFDWAVEQSENFKKSVLRKAKRK